MKYVTYSNSRMVLTSIIFFFNDVLSERGVEKERERQKDGEGEEGRDGEGERGRTRALYYAKLHMNTTEKQGTERRKKRLVLWEGGGFCHVYACARDPHTRFCFSDFIDSPCKSHWTRL